MTHLGKPVATAGVQIQLVAANVYVDLAVIVGHQQICAFRIEERHGADGRLQGHTWATATNHAVIGWAKGPFSRDETRSSSPHGLACSLTGMGLDVTPVLERAYERGWPREMIDEAAHAAEEARSERAGADRHTRASP
jgi:hypothetical protein